MGKRRGRGTGAQQAGDVGDSTLFDSMGVHQHETGDWYHMDPDGDCIGPYQNYGAAVCGASAARACARVVTWVN